MEGTIEFGTKKIPVEVVLWSIAIGLLAIIAAFLGSIFYCIVI